MNPWPWLIAALYAAFVAWAVRHIQRKSDPVAQANELIGRVEKALDGAKGRYQRLLVRHADALSKAPTAELSPENEARLLAIESALNAFAPEPPDAPAES
jgi:hypothetical protein